MSFQFRGLSAKHFINYWYCRGEVAVLDVARIASSFCNVTGSLCLFIGTGTFWSICSDLVTKLYDSKKGWFYEPAWEQHRAAVIPLVVIGVGAFLRWISNNIDDSQKVSKLRLQDTIDLLRETAGFGSDADSDIRICVWRPAKRNSNGEPTILRQITDYVPPKSFIKGDATSGTFRRNAKAGRIYRVFRSIYETITPIGILGKCVLVNLSGKQPEAVWEALPKDINLVDYLVKHWHFDRSHAQQVTQDRRAYLCLPVMTADGAKLLAVVYCDSKDPSAFPPEMIKRAMEVLPNIARAMST